MAERRDGAPGRPDADALCADAAACWEGAFRGYELNQTGKGALIRQGLDAIDRALALAPDHSLALTFKTLLLRLQASLERDPATRAALDREAEALRGRAVELQTLAGASPRQS